MRPRALTALAAAGLVLAPAPGRAADAVPSLSHVFVIVEENTDYSKIVGNTTEAPDPDPGRVAAGELPPILDYVNAHADSALFITFDEASNTDTSGCCDQAPVLHGGGHIGFVMVAPGVEKPGYKDTTPANHYSLLRALEDAFGLVPLGEAGSTLVSPMAEMFG